LLNMITATRLRATKGRPMAKYTEGTHARGEVVRAAGCRVESIVFAMIFD